MRQYRSSPLSLTLTLSLNRKQSRGLGLVEVMVATGIGSILMLMIASMLVAETRGLSANQMLMGRNDLVARLNGSLRDIKAYRNSAALPANAAFTACVTPGAATTCTAAGGEFYFYDNQSHPLGGTTANPIKFNSSGQTGLVCATGMLAACPLLSVTSFTAQCPSNAATCNTPMSVTVTFTLGELNAVRGIASGPSLQTKTGSYPMPIPLINSVGTAGFIPYWNTPTTFLPSSLFYSSISTDVGLNTTTPVASFDVAGTIAASGTIQADNRDGAGNILTYGQLTGDGGLELMRPTGGAIPTVNGYLDFLSGPANATRIYYDAKANNLYIGASYTATPAAQAVFPGNVFSSGSIAAALDLTAGRNINGAAVNATGKITAAGDVQGAQFYTPTKSAMIYATGNITGQGIAGINVAATSAMFSPVYLYTSDRRLKMDIAPLADIENRVEQLSGVSFRWKKDGRADIGFIAQDVETIFPELVRTNAQGFKSVEYGNIVAALVEAYKATKANFAALLEAQQTQINRQQTEIDVLKAQVAALAAATKK